MNRMLGAAKRTNLVFKVLISDPLNRLGSVTNILLFLIYLWV